MITISNFRALKVALHLITPANNPGGDFQVIRLAGDGSLQATNTHALIHSRDAHDSREDVYLRFPKVPKLHKHTSAVTIEGDTLTEFPRTEREHPVEVSTSAKWLTDIEKLVHNARGELAEPVGALDTIKAGRIAQAYGLNSPNGFWLPTAHPAMRYLARAGKTDTILLSVVHHDEENRFQVKPETATD